MGVFAPDFDDRDWVRLRMKLMASSSN